jgi:ABC-type sulfate transport system permease component
MRRGAPGSNRVSLIVILLLIVVLSVGLIGASPLALDTFRGSTSYWNRLSAIGQTYGAASAVLSVLTIIGVAVTLVLQARDSRALRLQAIRESHIRLLLSTGDVLCDAHADRRPPQAAGC